MASTDKGKDDSRFLPRLTAALRKALLKSSQGISTGDFVAVCAEVMPAFDHLGVVFQFAKLEFSQKNESLTRVTESLPTLVSLVDADKKAGTVTKKNSCARNLHRLMSAILFIQMLMDQLTSCATTTLYTAASTAYESALAPIHTYVVRNTVRAGLMTLPTRENFLQSIGETEASAKEYAGQLIPLVKELVDTIESMYDEPMPASNTWFIAM